jgi:nicotinamide riboside kinase
MFGIAGAHRTGKSTLAKRYAEEHKVPYLKLPNVIGEMGLTPGQIHSMDVRMQVQWAYLEAAATLYKANSQGVFITDRTPIDMAAYTLADIRQDTHPKFVGEAHEYLKAALALTNRYFSLILFVPPGIPYVDEPGKPPANPAYQELISATIQGLLTGEQCTVQYHALGRVMTDPERRWHCMEVLHEHLCRSMATLVAGLSKQ